VAAAVTASAAALLAAASAGAQSDGSVQGFDDGPPACSLVVTTPSDPRPAARGAEAWVQCNFRVTLLTLRSNAPIAKVRESPRLYGADAGDRLTCSRAARRRARCTGSLGSFTRPRIRLRLRRPTCADPALRMRVTASGGLDCPPDEACPSIGLVTRARSEGALGCA
jgi:hypothetical protein